MIIVVMGVAGSGKTIVASSLADSLGWRFIDADDFHPRQNIDRMASGIPLTDRDREPWLEVLRAALLEANRDRVNAVLACSSLQRWFRDALREGVDDVRFVYLRADPQLLDRRLKERRGHFMHASLLASQLAALEEPDDALVLEASEPVESLVRKIYEHLIAAP